MYLKVYNRLFDYGLSPNETKIYLFLSHCANALGAATVRVSTIAERTGIKSAATIRAQIEKLTEKGLICAVQRFNAQRRNISSQYQITPLKGHWFALTLDNNPFVLEKSFFQVYLYLCCRAGKNRRAFPSFTTMSAALRLSRQTVCNAIAGLVAGGWICKAAKWAGKHNLYQLPQGTAQEEQKERGLQTSYPCNPQKFFVPNERSKKPNKYNHSIAKAVGIVKKKLKDAFLWVCTSLKIDYQY